MFKIRILGERIYTTDVFGSLLMVTYMIYNVLNPIVKHTKNNNNEKNNYGGKDEKKINLIEQ